MWTLLIPLLAQLGGKFGDYFKQKADLQLEQLKTQREIELAKQQMAAEVAKAQLELNKTIVASTGNYFKYFTFFMWFGPFMVGTIAPARAHDIFLNWAGMPDWYVQSCMLIMFTVWGISVSAPVVGGIFSSLSQFMVDRKEAKRNFELAKAKINRDVVFDKVKAAWFPKGMNQQQVNELDRALDDGEK